MAAQRSAGRRGLDRHPRYGAGNTRRPVSVLPGRFGAVGMNYPTPEEIREARIAIERDGPMAEVTLKLSALVLKNDVLRAIAYRLTRIKPSKDPTTLVVSAITTGLNYGLRIHEQRIARLGRSE